MNFQAAGVQQGYARISPAQMDYLRMYCDVTRAQKAGKMSIREYGNALFRPVIEDCRRLASEYFDLKVSYEYKADEAMGSGDVNAANQLRGAAKVFGDFAEAASNLSTVYASGNGTDKKVALEKFLGIERYVLQNRMECLGRNWLTKAECEGILSKFGPPPQKPANK